MKMNQWTSTESQDTTPRSVRLPSSNAHRLYVERPSLPITFLLCPPRRKKDTRTDRLAIAAALNRESDQRSARDDKLYNSGWQAGCSATVITWAAQENPMNMWRVLHPAPRRRPSHTRPTPPNPLSLEPTSGKSFGAPLISPCPAPWRLAPVDIPRLFHDEEIKACKSRYG